MTKTAISAVIMVLMFGVASLVSASDDNWIVRGFYVKTWPSTDSYQTESVLEDLPPIFNDFSVDSGEGFEFNLEYKFNSKVGIALMGIFTDMEGTFVYGFEPGQQNPLSSDPNTVDFYTIDAGVNYHFTPDSRIDVYLGAFAGVFSYDSVTFYLPELDRQFKIDFDDQFSYGLNAGIDVPFTRDGPFIFSMAVKYLLSDLKEDGGPREIAIDPIIGSIGIGFRF